MSEKEVGQDGESLIIGEAQEGILMSLENDIELNTSPPPHTHTFATCPVRGGGAESGQDWRKRRIK